MMNLSNLLGLIVVIVLVQSNGAKSFGNVTKRSAIFDWKPYVCDNESFRGLKLLYVVIDSDRLYFYFPHFVVRITQVIIEKNYRRKRSEVDRENYFVTYDEPEYAKYRDMKAPPGFLDLRPTVFYQLVWTNGTKTYAYRRVKGKSKVKRLEFNNAVAG